MPNALNHLSPAGDMVLAGPRDMDVTPYPPLPAKDSRRPVATTNYLHGLARRALSLRVGTAQRMHPQTTACVCSPQRAGHLSRRA